MKVETLDYSMTWKQEKEYRKKGQYNIDYIAVQRYIHTLFFVFQVFIFFEYFSTKKNIYNQSFGHNIVQFYLVLRKIRYVSMHFFLIARSFI